MIKYGYSPFSLASSFQRLIDLTGFETKPNVVDDFLSTHPHLKIRKERFYAQALQWQYKNRDVKSYIGIQNLKQKIPRDEHEFPEEYETLSQVRL
jgi:predicted Zn-dependent protease